MFYFYFNHIFDNVKLVTSASTSDVFEQLLNIGENDLFFGIGLYGMLLWAVNPFPLFCALKGILQFRSERKNEEDRIIIGRSWLLFPAIISGSNLLYCISGIIMVALTDGA